MIQLKNISKTFQSKNGSIEALKDVSLHVKKGEIYGVIGYSGAGKSTLIRCINVLEKPTEGQVFVNESELTSLSHAKLNEVRKKIGMIFQGFNLLKTATVKENIAIPLKLSGVAKKEIPIRVKKYLEIVDLADKEDAYPAELSGGQKQRVAIARALSHEPEVLLSDEATSALDPETTDAILDLLLKVNKELGVTILLITHEMSVIQKICDQVAVIDDGKLVESGTVLDLFSSPKHETTKKFVNNIFAQKIPANILKDLKVEGPVVTISFIGNASKNATLATVTRKFDVIPNILFGHVTQLKDNTYGKLTVHLQGEPENITNTFGYLKAEGVIIKEI